MIPMSYINEWREFANWKNDALIEQDLILSRIIIELYQDLVIQQGLAFRGGTALQKLFYSDKQQRYSEDIDLVQINAGPIGNLVNRIRQKLDPWFGNPTWKRNKGRFTLCYKFISESENMRMKIKIEINTKEHFTVLGFDYPEYSMRNSWYTGKAKITSYFLEELLGTKMRALYQRKKARDFFDLAIFLQDFNLKHEQIIECFKQYIIFVGSKVSRAEFEKNLHAKFSDQDFIKDITVFLNINNNFLDYLSIHKERVNRLLVQKLDGLPWRGADV